MQVHRDRNFKTITLNMKSYIIDILKQYSMTECHARDAPCEYRKPYSVILCLHFTKFTNQ